MILDDNVKMNQPRITGMPNPIVSSDRCIKFRLPFEERKFQSKYEIDQTGRMLKDIQDRTGTRIEYQTMKDGSIDFIVYGKESYVMNAKQLILKDFQAPVTITVPVPKAIHGKLLGPKGVRILEIQSQTQTKITVPRQNEDSDIITIVGLKDNAEKAVERVEKLAKEFAAKSTDRITVERRYLLFITGPFNENIKQWEEKGVKVSTYSHGGPNGTDKDLTTLHGGETNFTLVGEQNAIAAVKEEIRQVYEERKKKCTTVNIEVKKAQHKYITGQRGEKLRTFFAKTGVSVEMPPPGSDSDTITLRGEQSKLGPALSELYSQAHSETDDYFVVENWLHKFLIGPRRSNSFDFKARGVSVQSSEDCIKLHGSPGEVELAKDWLEAELNEVSKRIIRKDIKIEARLHGYIIGKSGATVKKIRDESGAHIHVPEHDDPNYKKDVGVITLEGTAEAVALAEEKISSIAKKYEAQKKLIVPHAVHGMIIGKKGEKIKEIRDKFNQITINFPEAGVVSDEINLLGPKEDVENCYQYLTELSSELATITESQVTIPAKLHSTTYMGPKSRTIRQLLDEFKHKIILSYPPKIANTNTNNNNTTNTNNNNTTNTNNNNNNINSNINNKNNSNNSSTNNNKNTTVNGTMPQSETITEDESKKPVINASGDEKTQKKSQSPKSKKGNKDKNAHKVESATIASSDIVKIRGPRAMVEKACERLQQLAKECQERVDRKFQMVVTTKPEVLDKMSYLERQLVHKIRDQHDVKISMPERRSGATTARFTIIGIEAKVQAAAAQLETLLKRVEERVEERFSIPSRVHPMLIGSGGRAVKRLMDQYKVEVRFARHDDSDPDSVTLSGHPDDVAKAKAYMVSHAESCMRSVTSVNET